MNLGGPDLYPHTSHTPNAIKQSTNMATANFSPEERDGLLEFLSQITDEECELYANMIREHQAQERAGLLRLVPWWMIMSYLLKMLLNINFAVIVFPIGPSDPGGKVNPRASYVAFQQRVMSRLDYLWEICEYLRVIGASAVIENKVPFKKFFIEANKITRNIVQMLEAKEDFAKLLKSFCDENRHALWIAHLPPQLRNAPPEIQNAFKDRPWDMYMMPGTVFNPQDAGSSSASQIFPPGGLDILRDWESEVRDLQREHAVTTNSVPHALGSRVNLRNQGFPTTFLSPEMRQTYQVTALDRTMFPTVCSPYPRHKHY